MKKSSSDKFAIICLILAPLFWSGNFIIGKFLYASIPPFSFAFYRWCLVLMCLFPFVMVSCYRHRMEIKKNWFYLLSLSFLSVFVYTSFLYWGLHYTTVISASLLNAIVPILIVFFSMIFLKEKMTPVKAIAIMLSFFGAIMLVTHGNPIRVLTGLPMNKGDLIILVSVLAWAIFSVLYKAYPGNLPPFVFLFVTAFMGNVLILPAYLYEVMIGATTVLSIGTGLGVLYTCLCSSIIAFSCWNFGIKKVGPSQASYFFNLLPVFSTILAVIFLNEKMHAYHFIGMGCVFLGIFISVNKKLFNLSSKYNIALLTDFADEKNGDNCLQAQKGQP